MDMHLNLSHVPHLAPMELPSLVPRDPNVFMGTAGLATDDHPRKLLPQALGTEAKAKTGSPGSEAVAVTWGSFPGPLLQQVDLVTLGERKWLTQVSALWILSLGGQRKQK